MSVSVCAEPGCPELSLESYCLVHKPAPWQGSDRRKRLPAGWSSQIVPRILERDPVCRICNAAESTEVDHVQHGDDHSDENLQGVCSPCHRAKTAAEAAAARRRK